MKHFRIDGLYMRDRVYMEGDRRSPKALMFIFCDYLMLLMSSWIMISMLVGALSIGMDMKMTIYWLLPYSFVIFAIFLYSKYFWLKLLCIIIPYGYLIYRFYPRIENGFYLIENLAIDGINAYYNYPYNYFIADNEHSVRDLTIFMIFFMILVITVLILGMHREVMKNIAILFLSLPLILHFALGKVPTGEILILCLLVLIYYMKRPMDYKKAMSKVHQQIALILCGIVLLLYGLVRLLLSPAQYEEMEGIKELKTKVEAPFYEMTWDEFVDKVVGTFDFLSVDTAVGGLDGGKLGDVDQVIFTQSEQLSVFAPYSSIQNGLYLKGYVGSVYTGTSWESHEAEDEKAYQELVKEQNWDVYDPFNHVSRLLEMNESGIKVVYGYNQGNDSDMSLVRRGKITIDYKDATERFLYVPYHMYVDQYSKADPVEDLYIKPKEKKRAYQWDFYFKTDYAMLSDIAYSNELENSAYNQQKEDYRTFVYDAYTKVPEEGMGQLKKDMAKALKENNFSNYMEYVNYVIKFLHSKTRYSLSPGKLPEGKDYVEYFIYENNLGYCAHYATAASLMLRMMGVPTRYVEGYAVDRTISSSEGKTGDLVYNSSSIYLLDKKMVERKVLDSNAHAWIEVYTDLLGWIPVDVTPGSNYGNNEEASNILEQEPQTPFQEEDITEEATLTPTPEPTIEPAEEPTIEPTGAPVEPTDEATDTPNQNRPEGDPSSDTAKGNGNQETSWVQWIKHPIVRAVVISMAILGILIGSYRLYHWNIQRKLVTNKQKALYLYNQIERVLSICAGIPSGKQYLENNIAYASEKIRYLDEKDLYDMVGLAQKARFQTTDLSYEDFIQMKNTHQKIKSKALSNETLIKSIGIRIILLF